MLTAQKARDAAMNYIFTNASQDLEKVLALIQSAAEKGKYTVRITPFEEEHACVAKEEVRTCLRDLGYEIIQSTSYYPEIDGYGSCYNIYWRKS